MKKSSTPAAKSWQEALAAFSPKPPELELPDGPGCVRTPRPASVEQIHRHSEDLLRWLGPRRQPDAKRRPVSAEFVL